MPTSRRNRKIDNYFLKRLPNEYWKKIDHWQAALKTTYNNFVENGRGTLIPALHHSFPQLHYFHDMRSKALQKFNLGRVEKTLFLPFYQFYLNLAAFYQVRILNEVPVQCNTIQFDFLNIPGIGGVLF